MIPLDLALLVETINVTFTLCVIAFILIVSKVFTGGIFRRFFLFLKIAGTFYLPYLVLDYSIENGLAPDFGVLVRLLHTGFIGFVLVAFMTLYADWKRTKLNYPVHPPQSAQNPSGNQ
ncbi:MAG: hypothetical protein ACYCPW_03145 [Nitrososphaerales archaeon]